ncbi:phosphatidylinositol-4-phosphate-5-kinase-likep ro tein [Leptomonas pyrrhocoris]|uniref:Phosphatidylinositol-4-phosphate-5-kinase-likep ro tein n=1 Tax=Leptomonas pyrrhocoris TaxID=157538 RepID=A0A0M9G507_LEPPY|nr:phosphatidylinositol-4-phosphate-5-kinase-likep ro tein [Leptomonas pyrrhocoris]KPA82393.1 phosphatidylinositol-4-phosphate-5-kinase-likep ro tein [Leptomonas pyrrhocoris]|eukprot:XP_015660832.1 phosphatidylinositol-4-phosphate-5-kinase-likep ro tein [Leptomonas pyrrhocoris]
MPLNRELLASVKLEAISGADWMDEGHEKANDGRSVGADGSQHLAMDNAEEDQQNPATKNLIRCFKIALERVITSISLPEKQRPLNPKKDFSIEASMRFRATRSGGIQCCGAGTTNVKQRRKPHSQMVKARPTDVVGSRAVQSSHYRSEITHMFSIVDRDSNSDAEQQVDYGAFVMPGSTATAGRSSSPGRTRRPQKAAAPLNGTFVDFTSDDDDDDEEEEDQPPVNFTFTDYSPMCYRHVREFFAVDPKDYCNVLCNSRWHSIPTPGKSAAQLFFCGRDWVIKTMTDMESDFLRDILHRYYYHVRDNPYTLLPHFVGHHRMRIGAKTFNFIIMQNVFATTNTIHEKFDLKGSTIGRFASDAEKRRATCTQKDLDINSPLHVGSERRALLIDQIKKDCELLKRSRIMDYSFLVGICVLHSAAEGGAAHTGSPGPLTRTMGEATLRVGSTTACANLGEGQDVTVADLNDHVRNASLDGRCFTADQGGMLSSKVPGLRQEIYYIGIIDILQEYNTRKRLENVVFGTMHDRKRISCVDPNDYASRFIAFMSSIIV